MSTVHKANPNTIINFEKLTKKITILEIVKKTAKIALAILFATALISTICYLAVPSLVISSATFLALLVGASTVGITSILSILIANVKLKSLNNKLNEIKDSDPSYMVKFLIDNQSSPINVKTLTKDLELYNSKTSKIDPNTDIGKVLKIDLPSEAKLILKADLHGDFKSLIETLKAFQKQGYLDENFKVKDEFKNKLQIVFLGDYIDRGPKSWKTVQLLLWFKMLNANEVTLIKGNHEDINISSYYINPREKHFFRNDEFCEKFNEFCTTLPFAVLIGTKDPSTGRKQYTCCSHAAVSPDVDLNKLLENENPRAEIIIKKDKPIQLSHRILRVLPENLKNKQIGEISSEIQALENYIANQSLVNKAIILRYFGNIDKKQAKLILSTLRVQDFVIKNKRTLEDQRESSYSCFNWGDIKLDYVGFNRYRGIGVCLNPELVKDIFRISSSPDKKIKALRVGHAHGKKSFAYNNKQGFIRILPVAGEIEGYDVLRKPQDISHVVTLHPKVKYWEQQKLKRQRDSTTTVLTTVKPFFRVTAPRILEAAG